MAFLVTTQISSRAAGTADALNYYLLLFLLHGPLNGAVASTDEDTSCGMATTTYRTQIIVAKVLGLRLVRVGVGKFQILGLRHFSFGGYDPDRRITMVVEEGIELVVRRSTISVCIYSFHPSERSFWLMLAV
jgi:hypothetical protein